MVREIRRAPALLAAAGFILLCPGQTHAATNVTVSGRQILVDGQPFIARGVCYQPTPIGHNPSAAPPWGDYYTLSYRSIYERDLPNMRQMGANLIRVYSWDTTASHLDFLNKAYNTNRQPLYVLLNRWINPQSDWSNPSVVAALTNEFRNLALNAASHPTVLGVIIGNELNRGNESNSNFWNAVNRIAAAVKRVATNKLVTVAVTDIPAVIGQWNAHMTNIDCWSVQVYRGTSFGSFFNTYSNGSSKPLLITEYGLDAFNQTTGAIYPNNAQAVADAVQTLWRQMRTNRLVASGGCLFSYADEWWKAAGTVNVHDPGGFPRTGYPDGFSNEEWYGIFGIADNGTNPDILQPRALFSKLEYLWGTPTNLTLRASLNAGRLQTVFRRRADRDDLRYELEASDTLTTNWIVIARSDRGGNTQNLGAASVVEQTAGDERIVTVVNSPGTSRRFNRLRVTRY
ncbi:MAG: hypothetical protein L0Y58_07030 [Verrucomicrobia subdivision 3 bacterium]|nr:hypothetical protein [Limisphaerales bacterium]